MIIVQDYKVETEVVCFVCNDNTEHLIEYANGSIKSITCGACGVKYELIIEVSIRYNTFNVWYRVLTKPRRLLDETRDGLIKVIHSLPLRIVTKPYRLANEIIIEPGKSIEGSKMIESDIFCSACSEVTCHNLYYYDDKINHSVCTTCGLEIELLCLVIKYKNYPEEIIHRMATKPERLLKELHSRRSNLINSIPIRVVTKPYRLFREVITRMKKNNLT